MLGRGAWSYRRPVDTRIDEIADGVFRLSTTVSRSARTVNQFLIDGEEPLLFHAGARSMFPSSCAAVARVMPVERLRWLSFSHVEADEMGAMNDWLGRIPQVTVVHSPLGCATSIADLSTRSPVGLAVGERLELGGRRVRLIPTPDVPHNPEAVMLLEEVTATLCCSDLGSNDSPAVVIGELVPTIEAAAAPFPGMTSVTPHTPAILRELAALRPRTLGVMHGAAFSGDGAALLSEFAARCEQLLVATGRNCSTSSGPTADLAEMGHLADGSHAGVAHDANERSTTDTEAPS